MQRYIAYLQGGVRPVSYFRPGEWVVPIDYSRFSEYRTPRNQRAQGWKHVGNRIMVTRVVEFGSAVIVVRAGKEGIPYEEADLIEPELYRRFSKDHIFPSGMFEKLV